MSGFFGRGIKSITQVSTTIPSGSSIQTTPVSINSGKSVLLLNSGLGDQYYYIISNDTTITAGRPGGSTSLNYIMSGTLVEFF